MQPSVMDEASVLQVCPQMKRTESHRLAHAFKYLQLGTASTRHGMRAERFDYSGKHIPVKDSITQGNMRRMASNMCETRGCSFSFPNKPLFRQAAQTGMLGENEPTCGHMFSKLCQCILQDRNFGFRAERPHLAAEHI